MKEYKVYWIKEEFARHYYYKSDILYRFLKEYQMQDNRHDLVTQFNFITESFPTDLLIYQLAKQPKMLITKNQTNGQLVIQNNYNFISLLIDKKQIKFRCETLQDAETLLFPILRGFHPYFFIMDNEYENFGWISPVRTNIGYNEEKVLYS